jgi:hypothetical protein
LNARIRAHARGNGKALVDIADIEAHDAAGVRQVNASGWEIAYKPHCGEQRPDAQACHPNGEGSVRLAMALWWLMARVSGWDEATAARDFVRGDANADGTVDLADAIAVLGRLFAGALPPPCGDAADANDDGTLDLSDAVTLLMALFGSGRPLPLPADACGPDPTADALPCLSYPPCP